MSDNEKSGAKVLAKNQANMIEKIKSLEDQLSEQSKKLDELLLDLREISKSMLKNHNDLDAKITAGRKTATRTTKTTKTTGSPQGKKTYSTVLAFFKDKYLDDDSRTKFRGYLEEHMLTDIDEHMSKSKKTDDSFKKEEATYYWSNYAKKTKDGDEDHEKFKAKVNAKIKSDFEEYKKEPEKEAE